MRFQFLAGVEAHLAPVPFERRDGDSQVLVPRERDRRKGNGAACFDLQAFIRTVVSQDDDVRTRRETKITFTRKLAVFVEVSSLGDDRMAGAFALLDLGCEGIDIQAANAVQQLS